LQDSLYLEERDISGDLKEVSEDAFERQSVSGRKRLSGDLEEGSEDEFERHWKREIFLEILKSLSGCICKTVCTWKKEIFLEIMRKSLRIHLQDSQHLEERDLSEDLEEVFEDAFARQPAPGRRRSL
jgi:hypothetical protein